MDTNQGSLNLYYKLQGKIEVIPREKVKTKEDSFLLHTSGVAQPCQEIAIDYNKSFELIRRNNLIAATTGGNAVLGLGDIGSATGILVVEGKCTLFKEFANVDAFPIRIDSKDVGTIVQTTYLISQSFGGISLEDIAAPRCFEMEERLKELCDIPVFHDNQHGIVIVAATAILNALKITRDEMGQVRIVVNGAGTAGITIGKLLISIGLGSIIVCDINGIICKGDTGLDSGQEEIPHVGNRNKEHGSPTDTTKGADTLVDISWPDLVTKEMVGTMNRGIVLAMASPVPEIMPEGALKRSATMMGTGRPDLPNQINDVPAFPGIFEGVPSVRTRGITEAIRHGIAYAITKVVSEEELRADCIVPSPPNRQVTNVVARVVAETAKRGGIIGSVLSTISLWSGARNGPRIETTWVHSRAVATISGYQRLSHAPPYHPYFFVLRMTGTHYTVSPSGIISRIPIEAPVR